MLSEEGVGRTALELVEWLRDRVAAAGARGAVVGLSGGIDSAVVGALCKQAFPDATLGLILSCHSRPQDAEDARRVAGRFGIPVREVVLDAAYDLLLSTLSSAAGEPPGELARANLKPRLRMASLYFFANQLGYLVVGTGNESELTAGYFTKYGDGGVDLLPLGALVKEEVRQLAEHLGVPRPVIEKPPSAGLWEGQTDEGEMGIPYAALDRYIRTGEAEPEVRARIEAMHRASQHKRQLPPIFVPRRG